MGVNAHVLCRQDSAISHWFNFQQAMQKHDLFATGTPNVVSCERPGRGATQSSPSLSPSDVYGMVLGIGVDSRGI